MPENSRGARGLCALRGHSGCDAPGLDWCFRLQNMREGMGPSTHHRGNHARDREIIWGNPCWETCQRKSPRRWLHGDFQHSFKKCPLVPWCRFFKFCGNHRDGKPPVSFSLMGTVTTFGITGIRALFGFHFQNDLYYLEPKTPEKFHITIFLSN